MHLRALAITLLLTCSASQAGITFSSAHVVVVDEASGEVLLSKDGDSAAPIASLTKLMTAMVVLDAQQDPNELLRIEAADTDRFRHSRGGVAVGTVASRGSLLELALLASDNRAASALARHYPGGLEAFDSAMQRKIHALGLYSTSIEEPTGLSPNNVSSAQDMVKVLRAAARYPLISQITSQRSRTVLVDGRRRVVPNTNRLVGAPGWNVLLSKTGFTNDAGRSLAMRAEAAGRKVTIVLLGAPSPSLRTRDAIAIRRWLLGGLAPAAVRATGARLPVAARHTVVVRLRAGQVLTRTARSNLSSRASNPASSQRQ
jgi:D-alanyl-D-alanine carboxypeptidase/D-alanyl-D-alanine endopeptidase (penicillin-binding protein 7)